MSGTDSSVRAGQLTWLTMCRGGIVSSSKNVNQWKCLHEICIMPAKYLHEMFLNRLWWVFWPTIVHKQQVWKSRAGTCKYRRTVQRSVHERLFWDRQRENLRAISLWTAHTFFNTQRSTPQLQRLKSEAWGYGHRQVAVSRGRQLAAMDSNPVWSCEHREVSSMSLNPAQFKAGLSQNITSKARRNIWGLRHGPHQLGSQFTPK